MKEYVSAVSDWLDHRTGLRTAVRTFLYEDIPASSGWHQVFGSVAIFLFLVQALHRRPLGVQLRSHAWRCLQQPALYSDRGHRRTPDEGSASLGREHDDRDRGPAYGPSVPIRRLQEAEGNHVDGGCRATAAYVGIRTDGLPAAWDNRAYWGTVVTTRIAAQAPLLGPYLTRLLGGDDSIGVVTFARFFGLHVLLLPPATAHPDWNSCVSGPQTRRGAVSGR